MSRVARPAGWPDRSWPRSVPRVTRLAADPSPARGAARPTQKPVHGTADALSPNAISTVGFACSLSAIVLIALAPISVTLGVAISALLVLGSVLGAAAGRRRGAPRRRSIPPGSSRV